MDRPRVTPELLVGVLIVVFIAVTVIRPWGGDADPSPSVSPVPTIVARATTPPATPRVAPSAVPVAIVAVIPMTGQLASPIVDGDTIWYVSDRSSLTRLDAASLAVERVALEPGRVPGPVDMTALDGELWVAGPRDQSISRIDPATGSVTQQIPVTTNRPYALGGVFGLIRTASIVWAIGELRWPEAGDGAAPSGSPCCGYLDTSELVRVDLATQHSYGAHQVDGALAIAQGDGSVWVVQSPREIPARAILVRRDPDTGVATGTTVLPDPAGGDPCDGCLAGLAVGTGSIWVAWREPGMVLRIDPKFSLITDRITVGGRIEDIALGPDGSVWVVGTHEQGPDCQGGGGFLARIDANGGVDPGELAVSCPVSVAVSRGDVWVGTDAPDGPQVVQVQVGS